MLEYVWALGVRIRLASGPGASKKAEAAYQAGLTALAKVKGPATAEPSYRRAKSVLKAKWAVFLAETGREPEAVQPLREALALDEALAREFPRLPEYREWLASDFVNLGNLYASTKRLPEAEKAFRRSVTESQKLASEFPEDQRYRHDLAITLYNLGHLMIASGRTADAAPHFREAARQWPDYAGAYFGLAWVMKNSPAAKKSDAPEIIRLAEKAVALGFQKPQVWEVLGQAYCRNERWADALRALEKLREHFKDALGDELLFLAMAHWHLGHKDDAIRWYKHAVEREKQRPLTPGLRAEVAALLEIEQALERELIPPPKEGPSRK